MASTDFSVADVLAWARTKPADERYDYGDPSDCALCHFLIVTGRAVDPSVGPWISERLTGYWQDCAGDNAKHPYPRGLEPALSTSPHRYGALVKRLEAIVQETPVRPTPWLNPQTYLDADVGEVVGG